MTKIYRSFVRSNRTKLGIGFIIVCLLGGYTAQAQTKQAQSDYDKYALPVKVDPNYRPDKKAKDEPSSPGPAERLTDGQNDDVRLFASTNQQSEIHISVDKSSSCNLIASANTLVGGAIQQGFYYSNDGGNTWRGGDVLPNGAVSSGDPATAYDAGGFAYLAAMTPGPDGYAVQVSSTKGATWGPQVRASGPTPNFDKEMIAADNTPGSPFANNLYAAWTNFNGARTVEFNRSTNRGSTFSAPIVLRTGFGQGTNVQTGPNGQVYVCWADYGTGAVPANGIGFARSTDGGVSFAPSTIAFGYSGIRVQGTNPLFNNTRANDFPAMAVDKGAVHPGRIYIVYPTKENGNGKAIIQVRFSDNQGTSWSAPVTASIAAGRQNWFPWIAVDDATGEVSVVYYSFDTASGFATNTYVAYSRDGGASFNNLKVSDVAHITAPIPGYAGGYAGDYLGITAYGGRAYPVWSDNRSGTWQMYTSPVAPSYVIAGPDNLCAGATATYSIPNLPAGVTPIWSSSNPNYATINASTGVATAVGSNSSGVTFTATFSSSTSCGITKNVRAGSPGLVLVGTLTNASTGAATSLANNSNPVVQRGTYYVDMTPLTAQSRAPTTATINPWSFGDAGSVGAYNTNNNQRGVIKLDGYTGASVGISAADACGSTANFYFRLSPAATFALVASPNPASADLTVEAVISEPTEAQNAATDDRPAFTAQLYNSYGVVVMKRESQKGKVRFDTHDLPAGLYIMRAGTGKEAVSKHIEITH